MGTLVNTRRRGTMGKVQMDSPTLAQYERLQALNSELMDALREACAQLERISAELHRSEQAREQALLLNQELQNELRAFALKYDHLSERIDHVEHLVMGIFEGRIWRTLTMIASPLKAVALLRSKVSS
jgi:chromosome segregation ATPase